jgi:hypothetical protein
MSASDNQGKKGSFRQLESDDKPSAAKVLEKKASFSEIFPSSIQQPNQGGCRSKRIHLTQNHYMCQVCWSWWTEEEVIREKMFADKKGRPILVHSGQCGGDVVRYYDLSTENLVRMSGVLPTNKLRHFFPVMSDLTRGETGDTRHHNVPCTGSCCTENCVFGVRGWHPSPEAEVEFVVHEAAFQGWEEQSAKTCGAASVASALNTVLFASSAIAGSDEAQGNAPTPSLQPRRVTESDVLNYYALWATATSRIAVFAALRGSCGLIPSTRNIGNHRLTQACHAVAATACQPRRSEAAAAAASPAAAIFGGSFGRRAAVRDASPFIDDADNRGARRPACDGWPVDSGPSPVAVDRLLVGPAFRDSDRSGSNGVEAASGPGEEAAAEEAEWALLRGAVAGGGAVLVHSRNHYSCVYALRSWVCAATGAVRRQVRAGRRNGLVYIHPSRQRMSRKDGRDCCGWSDGRCGRRCSRRLSGSGRTSGCASGSSGPT